MGLGLTIGWQVTGHNLASNDIVGTAAAVKHGTAGAIASLVPAQVCTPEVMDAPPWAFVFGVLNFPMLFHCFLSLNMRVRDMWGSFIVVYPSLFLYITLVYTAPIPQLVNDAIGIFVGSNLACALEIFNGIPVVVSIVPMVIILAPGWPSVTSILASIQLNFFANESIQPFWTQLAFQGVAYAVGMSIALEIWKPLKHKRNLKRARVVHERF